MPKFKCVDSQSIFGGLSGIAMQGNCRQVEKDEAEDAPLTQGLCRKFLNGLIVDLQGSSPTFGMQVTLRGAGVELGGGGYAVYVKSVLWCGSWAIFICHTMTRF